MPLGTEVDKLIPLLFQVIFELSTVSSGPTSYCCSSFNLKQKDDGYVNKCSFHKSYVFADQTTFSSNVFVKQ